MKTTPCLRNSVSTEISSTASSRPSPRQPRGIHVSSLSRLADWSLMQQPRACGQMHDKHLDAPPVRKSSRSNSQTPAAAVTHQPPPATRHPAAAPRRAARAYIARCCCMAARPPRCMRGGSYLIACADVPCAAAPPPLPRAAPRARAPIDGRSRIPVCVHDDAIKRAYIAAVAMTQPCAHRQGVHLYNGLVGGCQYSICSGVCRTILLLIPTDAVMPDGVRYSVRFVSYFAQGLATLSHSRQVS